MKGEIVSDAAAREAARTLIDPQVQDSIGTTEVVDLFPGAEFETATTKIKGGVVSLRRVKLTGPWEVVATPDAT